MSAALLYAVTGLGLFSLGFHALIVQPHLLRKILAVNIMGSGVFLVLTALARRAPGGMPDPVPHAMVITGIVVAVAATALALVLLRRVVETTGQARLPDPDDE
ncbi:MAG: NADH-quinone oxidoreductase subunit K [Thiohalophilus sp.]